MQSSKTALDEINEFLLCETPEEWIKAAIEHQDIFFNKRKYENSKFNLKIIALFLAQILHTLLVVKKKE